MKKKITQSSDGLTDKQKVSKSLNTPDFTKGKILKDENRANLFYLGSPYENAVVYKYLNIESALLCLKNSNIRFVQPSEWEDKYECRFYKASYAMLDVPEKEHPQLYACCFTTKKMSEAAWKVYSYDKKGLAQRCVKFGINIEKLRDTLNKYAEEKHFNVYESMMYYSFSDDEIKNIHKKKSPYYSELFDDFGIDSYLTLLSIKRNAFSHECELRYFLVPKDVSTMQKQEFVELSYKDLVVDVKIAEDASNMEFEVVKTYCASAGIDINLIEKELLYHKYDINPNIAIEGDKSVFIHKIVDLIKREQGIQMGDISNKLGMHRATVRRLLEKYTKDGYIIPVPINPKGVKWYTSDFQFEEDEK